MHSVRGVVCITKIEGRKSVLSLACFPLLFFIVACMQHTPLGVVEDVRVKDGPDLKILREMIYAYVIYTYIYF